MNKLILVILMLTSNIALASTFIGNGGSVLDGELRAAISRLKAALQQVDKDEELCTCAGDTSQCAVLRDLNEKQKDYCESFVEEMSPALLKLLAEDSVQYKWESRLTGENRSFDGMASAEGKTILLDENRFATLSQLDRVQLLAHELLHLLKHEGKALKDKESKGPFVGPDGGRQLLDTAAAAIVITGIRMQAINQNPSSYSRPSKNFYLRYRGGERQVTSSFKKAALLDDGIYASKVELNWFPRYSDGLGYSLAFYSERGEQKWDEYEGLKSDMRMSALTLGIDYRHLLFETGHAWIDAIQVLGSARVGAGRVRHEIKDEYNRLSGDAGVMIGELNVTAQIPLFWNFWIDLSYGAVYSPYEIKKLNIKSTGVDSLSSFGVSYGLSF